MVPSSGSSVATLVRLLGTAAAAAGSLALVRHCVFLLGPDQQLLHEGLQRRRVARGPRVLVLPPWPLRKAAVVRAPVRLQAGQFVVVTDTLSAEQRNEVGPQLLFLEAYEELEGAAQATVSLSVTEYAVLHDKLTGQVRAVRGPACFVPGVKEELLARHEAVTLRSNEYVRLVDSRTGVIRVERGEALVWPAATEEVLKMDKGKLTALQLKQHEYARVVDNASGQQRVARGPQLVWLGPTESFIGGVKAAVEVDDEVAVLVRDKGSGQLRLEQERRLFFPEAHEEIVSVQQRVALAAHEAVIVKDQHGAHTFYAGSEREGCEARGSFFVPPHHSLVELRWSAGRRRERRSLGITVMDLRPQYMSFEFSARTSDNVELILEGTFFWQIWNVPQMVRTTGDTSGDICNHARSEVIQLVSQVTLKEFMTNFQGIAQQSHKADDEFYRLRGVKIHLMEITHYACANREDQEVLQQIIQETTHRMNRLQKQESENEVALARLSGQVREETARAELLELQQALSRKEAQTAGEAEADRVQRFLDVLGDAVGTVEGRLELWRVLRKNDALASLAAGKASLYFTPQDANLTIHDA